MCLTVACELSGRIIALRVREPNISGTLQCVLALISRGDFPVRSGIFFSYFFV